jgi:hypothetical protein
MRRGPVHQSDYIIGVGWHGHCRRQKPVNACGLGIHAARVDVIAPAASE